MTMVSSGKIALAGNGTSGGLNQSVEVELGGNGSSEISINDTNARTLAGIASGKISLSDFYGKSLAFIFNATLSGYTTNFVVHAAAIAAGWNGTAPLKATITVSSGAVLGSTSQGTYAFDTGTGFPAGSTIQLNILSGAYITGCGGGTWEQTNYSFSPNTYNATTGVGAPNGTDNNIGTADDGFPSRGGPAVILQYPTTILNSGGIIQGGGGAGGAGDNIYFGGGCGYYYGCDGLNHLQSDNTVVGYNYPGAGSLYYGAGYQRNPSGSTTNGGAGGGWVSRPDGQAPSSNGTGYGSPAGAGGPGTVNGGAPPGHAIDGTTNLVGGSTLGTTRGTLQSAATSSAVQWPYLGYNLSYIAGVYDGVNSPTGGGTGGGGGSGTRCVDLGSFLPPVSGITYRAYQVMPGDQIVIANPFTLDITIKEVEAKDTAIGWEPSYRIITKSGVSLVASASAPFQTIDGKIVNTPDLLRETVAIMKDNITGWDSVVQLDNVGMRYVRLIDVGENCYWAGETEGSYILHHI